jgi:biotin synthase
MTKKSWNYKTVNELYELSFIDLLYCAQKIHRQYFNPNEIQLSTLLSIKTGTCPEDCAYCPQSGHYKTGVAKQTLLPIEQILEKAAAAKASGATRFCMGAAWRSPPNHELMTIIEAIKAIKNLGLETCVTLGMLNQEQALLLKDAGLDYYNHNLDSSPAFYKTIITTRTYEDRLNTLNNVRTAGIKICCGGIIGMGEERADRIHLLLQLAQLPAPPESVPINRLIAIKGTPLEHAAPIDNFEFIRTIAVARIVLPHAVIRLSAGRENMAEETQALCFFAGANSIFFGDRLLVTANPACDQDLLLLKKLGIKSQTIPAC